MRRLVSRTLAGMALALYWTGLAIFVLAHIYTTVIAYQYLYAWKASRALFWIVATFFVPVVSTAYWLFVHWAQTGVFWNSLTLACASGVALLAAGMLCELLQQTTAGRSVK
ncbi:MAG: hypothetical protein ACK4UO_19075 [Pseudolabrys sp.]